MDTFKKVNAGLSLILLLLSLGTWEYWKTVCGEQRGCTLYQMDWIMSPLLWGSLIWAIILLSLLAFPARVFKRWLLHVGWWGALLTILYVISTDPRSSHILSPDRGQAAWLVGGLIAILTALYLILWYLISSRRFGTTPAPWSRLLALIPAALAIYFLSPL
jgi:hypothetical protein